MKVFSAFRRISSSQNWLDRSFAIPWILLVIAYILLGVSPITDSDVFMHLALGREFFLNGSVPPLDPYIISQFREWKIWHEWGGFSLLYGIYAAFGYGGLSVFKLFLAGAGFYPTYSALRKSDLSSSWPQFFTCICGFIALGLRFSERTALIADILFGLSIVLVVMDFREKVSTRKLWFLPFLIFVWANVHGSFPLAWGVICIWIASTVVVKGWKVARAKIFIFILCLVAPLLNPRGFVGILSLADFIRFRKDFLQHMILEWKPSFSADMFQFTEIWFFAAFLVLSSLIVCISLAQGNLREKMIFPALGALVVALAFSANRFIPAVVFGAIFIISSTPIKVRRGGFFTSSVMILTSSFLIFLLWSGSYMRAGLPHRIGFGVDHRVFPSDEMIEIVKSSGGKGPIRNEFYHGCYLAWMLEGNRKIFIHGYVTDIRVFQEFYSGFGASREAFDEDSRKWGTGAVLTQSGDQSGLLSLLQSHPDWQLVAVDEASILFVPNLQRK